jgi:hypothetical protein
VFFLETRGCSAAAWRVAAGGGRAQAATEHCPAAPHHPQVRLLCRRQFLARALGLKVAQAQRQAQRVSAASSGTSAGAPYTMTHGDTWTHR